VPVTLVSRDGAGATLIDAGGATIAAVAIDAAGTTFGAAKRGFTVTGSDDDAGVRANADGVRVEGNLSAGNGFAGVLVLGTAPVILGNQLLANFGLGLEIEGLGGVIRGNVAVGNIQGMDFSGGGVVVEDNLALGNQSSGFEIEDGGATVRRNVSLGNALDGFTLSDDCVLEGNLAAGNVRGVTIFGLGNTLRGNAIVGNQGAGVFVAGTGGGEIVGNSVFGNFAGQDPELSPALNCGVVVAGTTPPLLRGNFWGAASGPGADPADLFCGLLPLLEPPVFEPLAVTEIRVRVKAAQ
jgi:parallel beta-helix repeat protein